MMERVKLMQVCEVIAGQSPPSNSYNKIGKGLPFYQGKADFGELYPTVRFWCDKPIKIAEKDDILFSLRAPVGPTNLNLSTAAIGRGLAAIRSLEAIDNKFLLHYLRYKETEIADLGTGSTFKAITIGMLKDIEIPLPDLATQKAIAAKLDKADEIRQLNKKLIEQYDALTQSLFLDMFGDPVKNEKGWDLELFDKLGSLDRGKSKHRPRNAPELLGGKYPLIQTGDVANCGRFITDYNSTYSEKGLAQSKLWPVGTLCITIAANIAKTGILQFEACFPDSIVGFLPNSKTNVIYIQFWLSFLQKILEDSAPESAQKNINLAILKQLQVPLPKITLQNEFAERVKAIEAQKALAQQALQQSEDLFNSLLQESFQ